MKILFYLWGIANAVFFCLPYIFNARKYAEDMMDFFSWTKMMKEKNDGKSSYKWDELPERFQNLLRFILFGIFSYFPWLIIGLFSFNWFAFLAFLIFTFTVGKIGGWIRKSNNVGSYATWLIFWNLIEVSFILFVTINSYHLHIDLWQQFTSLF